MNILNKIFKRGENEEHHDDIVQIDENGNSIEPQDTQSTPQKTTEEIHYQDSSSKINLKSMINSLSLEEVHTAQELLDLRLAQLHKQYGFEEEKNNDIYEKTSIKSITTKEETQTKPNQEVEINEIPISQKTQTKSPEEINIEEDITEDDLDNKTYHEPTTIDKVSFEDEYIEFEEHKEAPKETIIEEKTKSKVIQEEVLDNIKAIFGEENIFNETRNDLQNQHLKGKEVYCIGIRNKDAFNDENLDLLKQNRWFIVQIKQLKELKNFKMINSSNIEKNLIWDIGNDSAILIAYKAINALKSINEFNFN